MEAKREECVDEDGLKKGEKRLNMWMDGGGRSRRSRV